MYWTISGGVYHTPSSLRSFRIEILEEGLVEERDGVLGLKTLEEFLFDNPVEAGGGPLQRLAQAQVGQTPRPGDFLVKIADQRQGEVLARTLPVETIAVAAVLPPEHPAGEEAVE